MTYALDSNIVSYMLKGAPTVTERYHHEVSLGNTFVIPPIVFYEIHRWLLAKNLPKKLEIFRMLCEKTGFSEAHAPFWKKAAELYASLSRQGALIEDADIFIAAFCLVNDYPLVTNNTRHFGRIAELTLVGWN